MPCRNCSYGITGACPSGCCIYNRRLLPCSCGSRGSGSWEDRGQHWSALLWDDYHLLRWYGLQRRVVCQTTERRAFRRIFQHLILHTGFQHSSRRTLWSLKSGSRCGLPRYGSLNNLCGIPWMRWSRTGCGLQNICRPQQGSRYFPQRGTQSLLQSGSLPAHEQHGNQSDSFW